MTDIGIGIEEEKYSSIFVGKILKVWLKMFHGLKKIFWQREKKLVENVLSKKNLGRKTFLPNIIWSEILSASFKKSR